jgi:hypothetical protein
MTIVPVIAGAAWTSATSAAGAPPLSVPPPIFARCSFRIALRDSRMRFPSTASTFTST